MASSYTSLLGLVLPVQGELIGTWGDTFNAGLTSLLDTAIAGTTTLSTDADVTLTTTTGASNQARQFILLCTGARAAQRTITAPAASKAYVIVNATTGGFAVKIVGVGPTTGVTVAAGKKAIVAWDGSDFVIVASTDLSDAGATTVGKNMATLTNPSAVTFPKFNADNTVVAEAAATYRTSLGATTVGANMFTLTNPSAVRYLQVNADNTVTALDAATFRTNIGAGTGGGSVTSVSGTGTVSGLTLSGTVTSTGNLTLGGTLSLTSGNVTTALGYTPYNSSNPSGYITSSGSISGSAGSVPWSGVTSKPTTISGYGITDAITTGNIGSQSVSYASSAGNADTVDGQHFTYSNSSNSPTYLWSTDSSGSSYLAARGSISVNYATSAGSAGYATSAGSAPAAGGTADYVTNAPTPNPNLDVGAYCVMYCNSTGSGYPQSTVSGSTLYQTAISSNATMVGPLSGTWKAMSVYATGNTALFMRVA